MKVLYFSLGNIPSLWAHSLQMMKMSEALNAVVDEFMLITGWGWEEIEPSVDEVFHHYGIHRPFPIKWINIAARQHQGLFGYGREPFHIGPLWEEAWAFAPDVIFSRDVRVANDALYCHTPLVFEMHSPVRDACIAELVELMPNPNFLGLITLTEALKYDYIQAGMPEDKVLVLPSGMSAESYTFTETKQEIRLSLSLNPSKFTVIYTGTPIPHKGIPLFLELSLYFPDVQFLSVGGNEELEFWNSLIEFFGIKNVEMRKAVSHFQIARYLYAADVCILPNDPESEIASVSFPLKLVEYLMSGRPVLASRTPCLEGALVHEENALLAEYTARSFAQELRRLIVDPELCERLAEEGRKIAAPWTWAARVKKILSKFDLPSCSGKTL